MRVLKDEHTAAVGSGFINQIHRLILFINDAAVVQGAARSAREPHPVSPSLRTGVFRSMGLIWTLNPLHRCIIKVGAVHKYFLNAPHLVIKYY